MICPKIRLFEKSRLKKYEIHGKVIQLKKEEGRTMQSIKNTLRLYLLDWKRIFKNPIATLLIIAIMIIPSLYAWFNIKALWDPYGNTGELPIAVYSADKPAEFQGKEVAIGEQVIESLHKINN